MMKYFLFILLAISSHVSVCQSFEYPKAKKSETRDNYFGHVINDPYRWFESENDSGVENWVDQQNVFTQQELASYGLRDSINKEMKRLWNFSRYQVPFKCGNSYFYYRQEPNMNQPLMFYMKSMLHVPMSYLDVNKMSEDGTTYFSQTSPSSDGKYIAFQISEAGSDWNRIRIKEVQTMKSLPENLTGIKFSNIAWYKDGFFYSRYNINAKESLLTAKNQFHKVYFHHLNADQTSDSLVFEDNEHPLRNYSAIVSDDDRYLFLIGSEGTSGNSVWYKDLTQKNMPFKQIYAGFDYDFDFVGISQNRALFLTNFKASNKKLVAIDFKNPSVSNWIDVIPEQKEILQSVTMAMNGFLVHYLDNSCSKLYVYSTSGVKKATVPINGFGSVDGITGHPNDSIVWISYTNFLVPNTIYYFNMKNLKLYEKFKSNIPFDAENYETKQVFYTSKDNTKIPMFIVHKKGVVLDGNNPTLLFGYGGFNINKTPEFKTERILFLQKGGVFAMPNLRGGGEYGEKWHKDGMLEKKQHVFDDFIAAAEFLIDNKYTNPSRLAIGGRSNGGLLVGAVMCQRPELFKVALPAVGVMDMLRYHKFTIGWAWKGEFGSSEDSISFNYLIKYSPLHNIKKDVVYPATFVTTADHDDRVVPAHSYKFIATLQEAGSQQSPYLIRIDKNAGHGAGKSLSKQIEEQSDIFSFVFYHLKMKL